MIYISRIYITEYYIKNSLYYSIAFRFTLCTARVRTNAMRVAEFAITFRIS